MSLADSIRQTASIARWVSESATALQICFASHFGARARASRSRSSGVNASPKSSASNTWRISISDSSPGIGFGQRLTHSIASSFDLHLPEPEAGDQLLGLGERAVDHRALRAREPHPRALRARLQALAGQHDAGLHQLLVELAHLCEQLGAGHHAGFRALVGLDDDHEPHGVASQWRWVRSRPSERALSLRRTSPDQIDTATRRVRCLRPFAG